jgi:biopolymer transport protein ExbB
VLLNETGSCGNPGSNVRKVEEIEMDIVERMSGLTDLGARWVMWLLLALSVVAIAIIIERAILFFSSRDDVSRLRRDIRRLLEEGQEQEARARLEARVAAAGLECSDAHSANERMQGEQEAARLTLEKRLAILGTLGNNAPFIGLLGTVIGIVRSFQELENAKAQVSAGLMAEIGEALIATAIGLLVALPAVAAFNAFQRVVRERLGQADVLRHEILSFFKAPSATAAE